MPNIVQPEPDALSASGAAPFRGEFESRELILPSLALTPFLGREQELRQAASLFTNQGVRILTLTGPGGVGKTRLATRLIGDLATEFTDGAAMIPLASVRDADSLIPVIAQTLGIRGGGDQSISVRLGNALRSKHLLLLLDNFEQIITAAAYLSDLLVAAPGLKLVVTSRVPLRIAGEQELAVQPFELPELRTASFAELLTNPAVALFAHRASSVRADFTLHENNAEIIATVCRRLEGLPLAIELAAARTKVLSPAALLARLSNSLDVLTGGPRDSPDRLRTMRAAIAWSYELLSPEEQTLFESLAVFSGGFSLDAAERITGSGNGTTLDFLASLVDSSLLRIDPGIDGEPRFGMLETVREFGLEKALENGNLEILAQAHTAFYQDMAEQAEPLMYGGPTQISQMDRIELDHDNLRAALHRAEDSGDMLSLLRISAALAFFWYVRGYLTEGRQWLCRGLDRGNDVPAQIRAHALWGSGLLAIYQGDTQKASDFLGESLALSRQASHIEGIIMALGLLGVAAEDAGDYERASAYLAEGLDLYSPTKAPKFAPALVGQLLTHSGISAWGMGDVDRAVDLWETSLADQRARHDYWGMANSLGYLALIACERGELDRAAGMQHESLSLYWHALAIDDIAGSLSNAACIIGSRGEYVSATRLFSAADALRREIGSQAALPERLVFDRVQQNVRSALPDRIQLSAWNSGQELTKEAAVAEALETLIAPAGKSTSAGPLPAFNLTTREVDVLRLLVAGQTDREIAASLYISPRTAQGHVAHLFDKLGVSTRTAAVALALQENLIEF